MKQARHAGRRVKARESALSILLTALRLLECRAAISRSKQLLLLRAGA